MSNFKQELAEILRKHRNGEKFALGLSVRYEDTLTTEEADLAITKLIEEQVIGEDENMWHSDPRYTLTEQSPERWLDVMGAINRNNFKAEQRAIVRGEQ